MCVFYLTDEKTKKVYHKDYYYELFELIAEDENRHNCSMSWEFKEFLGNNYRVRKSGYDDARTTIQDLGLAFNCREQVAVEGEKFCVQTHIDWYEKYMPPIMRNWCVAESDYPWSNLFLRDITLPEN